MRSLRSFLMVGVVSLTFGCRSVVIADDDSPVAPDPGPEPACVVDPVDLVTIEDPRVATLFGDRLHLEARVGGRDGYALIDLSTAPGRIVGFRDDLGGGSAWTHVAGTRHARVRGQTLEVLEVGAPDQPTIVSSTELGFGLAEGFDTVASDGEALYFCLGSETVGESFLSRVDLVDPVHPGEPTPLEDYPCEFLGDRGVAQGSLWVTWEPTGSVQLYDLTQSIGINSHGFATDGVHHYGGITTVKTDGAVAAAELVNDAYTFLYYPPPAQFVVYSSFGAGPKRLLNVVDGDALVAVPSGLDGVAVVAFDVRSPPGQEQGVPRGEMQVELVGAETALEAYASLAHDATRVFVSDGQQLFDVPIGGVASVQPMVVLREGAHASCD